MAIRSVKRCLPRLDTSVASTFLSRESLDVLYVLGASYSAVLYGRVRSGQGVRLACPSDSGRLPRGRGDLSRLRTDLPL